MSSPKHQRNRSYQSSSSNSQKNIFKPSISSRISSKSKSTTSRHQLNRNTNVSRHSLYSPTTKSSTKSSTEYNTSINTSINTSTNFPSLNKKSVSNTSDYSLDYTKAVKSKVIQTKLKKKKSKSKSGLNTRIVDSSGTELNNIGTRNEHRYVDIDKMMREEMEKEQDEHEEMYNNLTHYEYQQWLEELEEHAQSDEYEQSDCSEEHNDSDY